MQLLPPTPENIVESNNRISQRLTESLAVGSHRHAARFAIAGWYVLELSGAKEIPGVTMFSVPLIDFSGNPAGPITTALAWAVARIRSGEKVFVCCEHGANRSPAICVGVLFLLGSYPTLATALKAIVEVRPRVDVVPPPTLRDVRDALGVPL